MVVGLDKGFVSLASARASDRKNVAQALFRLPRQMPRYRRADEVAKAVDEAEEWVDETCAVRRRAPSDFGVPLKEHNSKRGQDVMDSAEAQSRCWSVCLKLVRIAYCSRFPRIVRDANMVAATTQGASHLSATGRAALFAQEYPLAWGKSKAKVDVLLTGVAQVAPDLEDLQVHILMIRPAPEELSRTTFMP